MDTDAARRIAMLGVVAGVAGASLVGLVLVKSVLMVSEAFSGITSGF